MLSLLQKMMAYDDVSRKCDVVFKMFFAFLKVFKLLSMCTNVHVTQWQFSIQKKDDEGSFTLTSPSAMTRSKYVGGDRVN